MKDSIQVFDWQRMLLGDTPAGFLLEIIFRSLVMYFFILLVLRFIGKRGVRQLSIFELAIIIVLGSAAGDPTFYDDVPLLHGIAVLLVILAAHRGFTYLNEKNQKLEDFIEGKPTLIIEKGVLCWQNFDAEDIAQDELFSALRVSQIEHLGQVERAYVEPDGRISIFRRKAGEVRPGLPVFPESFKAKLKVIHSQGVYACSRCGTTCELQAGNTPQVCENCKHYEWIPASEGL